MKVLLALCLSICSAVLWAKSFDSLGLTQEITALSKSGDYEVAIQKLQWIVLDENTSNEAKAEAYFLKHEIYSKIGIYTEAHSNLTWFYQQAEKTKADQTLYKARFTLAEAILFCKKLDYTSALTYLDEIRRYSTAYKPNEYALYLFLEGLNKMEIEQDYHGAAVDLEGAITLLKIETSEYLPFVYKELLRLHCIVDDYDAALKSYNEGLDYGLNLKVISEVFQLHRFMAEYYHSIGKHKESLALSETILETSSVYNTPNISSKLYFAEKKVLDQSKTQAQAKRKRIQYLLSTCVFSVCLLIGFSYHVYKKNKKKQKLIAQENMELKNNYTSLKKEKIKLVDEPVLTERQTHILDLVKQGKTNREIAALLCISPNTVKYHLKIIYDILKIKGRSDLL